MKLIDIIVNSTQYDTIEDAISETCGTYEQIGQLIGELLAYHLCYQGFEDRALDLASDMMRAYIDENV